MTVIEQRKNREMQKGRTPVTYSYYTMYWTVNCDKLVGACINCLWTFLLKRGSVVNLSFCVTFLKSIRSMKWICTFQLVFLNSIKSIVSSLVKPLCCHKIFLQRHSSNVIDNRGQTLSIFEKLKSSKTVTCHIILF